MPTVKWHFFNHQKYLLFLMLLCISGRPVLFAQLQADFTADKTGGCSPLTIYFTNNTKGAGEKATYQWQLGNGNTSSLASPGAIYTDERAYTVILTVTDSGKTSVKTFTITVFKKPEADFSAEASRICLPSSAIFNSTSLPGDGSITSYYWDFGDGATLQGSNTKQSHNYAYVQEATVSLTVTNSHGCFNSVVKNNVVKIMPELKAGFTFDRDLVCKTGDAVLFSNSSTGQGTLKYSWNFADGTSSTEQSPNHNFSTRGLFNISMTVSNTDGCSAESTMGPINVGTFNTAFTENINCRQVDFKGASFIPATASEWLFGDNSTSNTINNTSHTYASPGDYTVKLVNSYGVCKDSVIKNITAIEKVDFKSSFTSTPLICKGNEVRFTPTAASTPSSSFWDYGNGKTDLSPAIPFSFYNTPGKYTVKLTNTFGTCKEEVFKEITVNDIPDIKPFTTIYSGSCEAPMVIHYQDNTPDAVKWDWNLYYDYNGTGTGTSILKNPSYTYPKNDTYVVGLTVTNAGGCTNFISQNISIAKPFVQVATNGVQYEGGIRNCGPFTMKFAAYSSEEIADYSWNFGDGSPLSVVAAPDHKYSQPGTYSVVLNYTTINGCKGTASYGNLVVFARPIVDFDYTMPSCTNSASTILNLKDLTDASTDRTWTDGTPQNTSNSTNPQFRYDTPGFYNIKLVVSNGGCLDSIEKRINVDVLPSFVSITETLNTCEGNQGEVTFTQSSLRAKGLTWDFGDGVTAPYDTDIPTIKHTYQKTGTYNVTLTGTYGTCALRHTNSKVKVLLKQAPSLTISKDQICSNESATITIKDLEINPFATRSNEQDHYTIKKFEYDDGTNFTGTAGTIVTANNYSSSISRFKKGDIRIRAIVNEVYTGCQDTSNYVSLKIIGAEADFSVINNLSCYKSPVTFQDLSRTYSNVPVTSWTWNFGDGESATFSAGSNTQHTYLNPGVYKASLTIKDASGCSSSIFATDVIARGVKAAFSVTGTDVPLGTTVTFTNNSNISFSDPGVQYLWQYGDGATSTGRNGSHQYNTAGDYTIQLTVTDPATSCTDMITKVVHVKNFNTAFSVNLTNIGMSGCPPLLVKLVNLSAGATSVEWDFGDGTEKAAQLSPSHIYSKPGKYIITLYTFGPNGLTGTFIDSVRVIQPAGSISADKTEGCTKQQITFSANTNGTEKYLWDMGDGTLKELSSPTYTHVYLTSGIFNTGVILKDANGCSSALYMTDKIVIDSLNISLNDIKKDFCQSANATFAPQVYSIAETLGKSVNYQWSFGTGNPADASTNKMASFAYNAAGKYTVKLTGISSYGCRDEDQTEIVIHSTDPLKIVAKDVDVCINSTAVLNATGADTYEWIGNTESLSDIKTAHPTVTTLTDAVFTVKGYDQYLCASGTADVSVKVRPLPIVNAGEDLQVLANTEIRLQATGSDDVLQYAWSPATYLSCINCASPISKPKRNIEYVVKGTTAYNCESTDTIHVKMLCKEGYLSIPNSFTPNRDGKNDVFYIKGKGIGIIKSFRIFNRWGVKVFERYNIEIDDRSLGWDGYFNNNPVPMGAYVYIAEMKCETGGDFIQKGTVTVIY